MDGQALVRQDVLDDIGPLDHHDGLRVANDFGQLIGDDTWIV